MKKIFLDSEEKESIPPDTFEIDSYNYAKNRQMVERTWANLKKDNVQNIKIDLEEPFMKPKGSIAWIMSMVGRKSAAPVNMNQSHETFKAQFNKAGVQIFHEIKFSELHKSMNGTQRMKGDLFYD
jgi:hypothetical protein